MKLSVNGEVKEIPDGLTVGGLLGHLDIKETRVAVERNREIVPKAAYGSTRLETGDQIEIVWFVGGGA